MRRLALAVSTALVLAVAPLARAGGTCAHDAAAQAAPADRAAEPQAGTGATAECKADGACCGDPACGTPPGDQASASAEGTCPCARAKEKKL